MELVFTARSLSNGKPENAQFLLQVNWTQCNVICFEWWQWGLAIGMHSWPFRLCWMRSVQDSNKEIRQSRVIGACSMAWIAHRKGANFVFEISWWGQVYACKRPKLVVEVCLFRFFIICWKVPAEPPYYVWMYEAYFFKWKPNSDWNRWHQFAHTHAHDEHKQHLQIQFTPLHIHIAASASHFIETFGWKWDDIEHIYCYYSSTNEHAHAPKCMKQCSMAFFSACRLRCFLRLWTRTYLPILGSMSPTIPYLLKCHKMCCISPRWQICQRKPRKLHATGDIPTRTAYSGAWLRQLYQTWVLAALPAVQLCGRAMEWHFLVKFYRT